MNKRLLKRKRKEREKKANMDIKWTQSAGVTLLRWFKDFTLSKSHIVYFKQKFFCV